MTYMFLIPLGAIIPLIFIKKSKNLKYYDLAIISLTLASFLKGVMDIAGTSSYLLLIYIGLSIYFLILFFTKNSLN